MKVVSHGPFDSGYSKDYRDSTSAFGDLLGWHKAFRPAKHMWHVVVERRQLDFCIVHDVLEEEFEHWVKLWFCQVGGGIPDSRSSSSSIGRIGLRIEL